MALEASNAQQQIPTNVTGVSNEDALINQAIMQSLQPTSNPFNPNLQEPVNPEQRKREEGIPCGLKNIGNTCYFNSILQVYYNIPDFVQAILQF